MSANALGSRRERVADHLRHPDLHLVGRRRRWPVRPAVQRAAIERWYRAALQQGGGRIRLAGAEHEVAFTPADTDVFDAVDEAYRDKYDGSPYVAPMIAARPRLTTVRVMPGTQGQTSHPA